MIHPSPLLICTLRKTKVALGHVCISSSHDCIGQRFRKQIDTSYDANNLVIVIDDTEETETEGTEQTVRSLLLFVTEKCSVVS